MGTGITLAIPVCLCPFCASNALPVMKRLRLRKAFGKYVLDFYMIVLIMQRSFNWDVRSDSFFYSFVL